MFNWTPSKEARVNTYAVVPPSPLRLQNDTVFAALRTMSNLPWVRIKTLVQDAPVPIIRIVAEPLAEVEFHDVQRMAENSSPQGCWHVFSDVGFKDGASPHIVSEGISRLTLPALVLP